MKSLHEYAGIVGLLAPSLAAAAAVSLGASQVGTFVLARRDAMMALALPHVVAVGAAAGLRFGWPPLAPALAAAALAVALLARSGRGGTAHWLLPAIYVAGLSISFLVIAGSAAHVEELQNLFTGIDVAVSAGTALAAIAASLAAGLAAALLWRRWLALAQAPAAAELAGLRPARWDALFLGLVGTVVLAGTSALGAVMVLAGLFLPAAAARPWAQRLPAALVMSGGASLLFLVAGFALSIEMDWPFSQSVGAAGFAGVLLSHAVAGARRSRRAPRPR